VLFYKGHILVDAVFSQQSVMSAAELRELARVLPKPGGNAGALPPVLAFMPHHGYQKNTEKYAEGALALANFAPPMPIESIDFSANPEVTLGEYSTPSGDGRLMLIYYPTPQVAIEQLKHIDAARQASTPPDGAAPFFAKRTGPIIAVVGGTVSERDAQTLLGAVNYEASVTWNENTYFDKKNNVANFLVNLILLCMILGVLAVALGVAFGGVRVMVKRLYPGKVFDRPSQMEFISLHLTETIVEGNSGGAGGMAEGQNGR
jgi:hypothetical protein